MTAKTLPAAKSLRSARARLAFSYALFAMLAGIIVLGAVYAVLRYIPNYPLTAANPSDYSKGVPGTRGEILETLLNVGGWALVSLAIVGSIGGWFLAGRVLSPLNKIYSAAHTAANGELGHRIRLQGPHDEFGQLADEFDRMLDKVEDAFNTQERFAGNASHELRTPLAITKALLDVARRQPTAQDVPVLLERLALTNDRAIGLTEALLRLADANAVTAESGLVRMRPLILAAVQENEPEASHSGVRIDTSVSATEVIGDGVLLRQMVFNLVQNAVRHNHENGSVWISGDFTQETATLRIENTGPVLQADIIPELLEPFRRGQGRVAQNDGKQGYGLGLALVAKIVQLHHGTLRLQPRTGGGLIATVEIPAAQQPSIQPGH
ncbi:sensor histidine kinase [Paenarthrobacter sp. NPDC056912]|uniref:sensor histidine kinase n=1 Tax=Paenarthrobacter sp. NPDC056912 TaxID=3345965 RepID=UPI00366C0AB0